MELKPCPFCGANAELQTNMFAGDSCCWIECLRCGTEGPLSDTVKLPEAQDQAIAKWNRRAQLAAPAAPVQVTGAEPAAWFWRNKDKGTVGLQFTMPAFVGDGSNWQYELTPLYAAQPAPGERQP